MDSIKHVNMEEKIYAILRKHRLPLKKREELMVDLCDLYNVSNCDNTSEEEEDVIIEDECPKCGSDAVGFNGDNNECFTCGSEW